MTTNFRAPVRGSAGKVVRIPSTDTQGAMTLAQQAMQAAQQALALIKASASAGNPLANSTTDDLNEGQFNLYFTDPRAQHAVGEILVDSPTIALTYDPSVPSIRADAVPITAIARSALSGQTVAAVDGNGNAYNPDLSNPQDVCRIVGVTLGAAALGAEVQIASEYEFTESSWNWSPGRVYCATNGGALTQTPPSSPSAIVEIARALSPTTIRVGIQSAIII